MSNAHEQHEARQPQEKEKRPPTPEEIIKNLGAENDAEIKSVLAMGGSEREVTRMTKAATIAAEKGERAAFEADRNIQEVEITTDTVIGLQGKRQEIIDNLNTIGVPAAEVSAIEWQIGNFINHNEGYTQQRDLSIAEHDSSRERVRAFFKLKPIDAARIDEKATALEATEAARLNCVKLEGLPDTAIADLKTRKADLIAKATGAPAGFDAAVVSIEYDTAVKSLEEMISKPLVDQARATAIKAQVEALLGLKVPDILNAPDNGLKTVRIERRTLTALDKKRKAIERDIHANAANKLDMVTESADFVSVLMGNNGTLQLSAADEIRLTAQIDEFLNLDIPDEDKKKARAEKIHKANPTWDDVLVWETACGQLEEDVRDELRTIVDISFVNDSAFNLQTEIDAAKDTLAAGIATNLAGIDTTINRPALRVQATQEVFNDFRKELDSCVVVERSLREMTNRDLMARAGLTGADLEQVAFAERSGLERDPAVREAIERAFQALLAGNPMDGADLTLIEDRTGLTGGELSQLESQMQVQRNTLMMRLAEQNVQPKKWATKLQLGAGLGLGGTAGITALLGAGTLAAPWLAGGAIVLGGIRIGQHIIRSRKVNQEAINIMRSLQTSSTTGETSTATKPIYDDLRNSLYSLIASAKQTQVWEQTGGVRRMATGDEPIADADERYYVNQRNLLVTGDSAIGERGMREVARDRLRIERPDLNVEQIEETIIREEALLESDIGTYERTQEVIQRGGRYGVIGRLIRNTRSWLVAGVEGRPSALKGGLRAQLDSNFDQRARTTSLLVGAGLISRYAATAGLDGLRSVLGTGLLGFAGQALGGGLARRIERTSDVFRLTHNVRVEELTSERIAQDPTLVSRARAQISDRDWVAGHQVEHDKLFLRLDQIEQALINRQERPL